MDPSSRDANALRKRSQKLMAQFVTRWESIMALMPMDETDLNTSMYAQYQMETETAWLVRNAEETLRLIRQMQELWLFGTLDTVGKSDVELKTEEETRRVAGLLEKMIEKQVGADGIGAVDVAGDERSK